MKMNEIRVSYTAHARETGDFSKVEFAFSLDEDEIRKNTVRGMQSEAKRRALEGLDLKVAKKAWAAGADRGGSP